MAPKAAQEAAKKKAAKQKKILIVLGLLLVLALGYAVMTLTSLNSSPPVQAVSASATTPAGSIPNDTSAAVVTPGIAAPAVGSLRTFTGFGLKDPFHNGGPNGSTGGSSKSAGGKIKDAGSGKGNGGGGSKSKQPSPPLTGAVISLNGKKLALAVGTEFGRAPGLSGVLLFRLVTVSARSALVAVVGTRQHFTIHVRRPLTLRQNGGWTYTLILEPLGSAAPMTVAPTNTIH
ncbi:MAG TPA: hypothetical protein VMU72_09240 [Gaiellaceae bacterium]|nr:hypothetical protein [Gaiellaceae bacterium]